MASIFDNAPDFSSAMGNQPSLPSISPSDFQDTMRTPWINSQSGFMPYTQDSFTPSNAQSSNSNFVDNLWNGIKTTGMGLLGDLANVGRTIGVSVADPIIAAENWVKGQPIDPMQTFKDIGNLWANPGTNDITAQRFSQAFGESPDLAQKWFAPSRLTDMAFGSINPFGTASKLASGVKDLISPTEGFASNLVGQLPQASNISADFGKWPTVGDMPQIPLSQQPFNALSKAPDFSSIPKPLDFNTDFQNDVPGVIQSALDRFNSRNTLQDSASAVKDIPATSIIPKNIVFPQNKFSFVNPANQHLQDLFDFMKSNGAEPQAAEGIWNNLFKRQAGMDFSELLNQVDKNQPSSIVSRIRQASEPNVFGVSPNEINLRNMLRYEPGVARTGEAIPEVLSPIQSLLYTVRNDSRATPPVFNQTMNTLKTSLNLPESQLRAFGDRVAMNLPVQETANEVKPNIISRIKFPEEEVQTASPVADQLLKTSETPVLDEAAATSETPKNMNMGFSANSFTDKIMNKLKPLFSLKGTLGDKFQDYYNYLSNKEYRTGQAAQDIMNTFKNYSPEQLKEFRLERDAGRIGAGHKYEALNNAYDQLLSKYTGKDVENGLERGNLKNYLPRMMDVDKGNLASVKRSMGNDSLGRFAEDRTDKRSLYKIKHDEGKDPYKDDMYELTLARLQSSINAQEARKFIEKVVNDGKAIKFENPHKAFTSKQYKKDVTGVYVDPITKETYLMPDGIAKFLNKEKDFSDLKQYLGAFDAFNGLTRRITITNPFVHFPHNILTSIPFALNEAGKSGLNTLNPSFWAKGMKKAREANPALIDEMERMGVLKPDYIPMGENSAKDLAHEASTQGMSKFGKYVSDIKHQATTGSKFERVYDTFNAAMKPVDALTWKPEHAARVAVYSTAKEMGATPEEAANIIKRNFGTNTKTLTPFEKNVLTRAFTFYPWLKHIFTFGARNTINAVKNPVKNPYPWLTAGTLVGANFAGSGHGMWDNQTGHKLQIDTGHKDDKGNETFVDPYLPLLEGAKFLTEPVKFLYNRMNQGITIPINMIANRQYGPASPSDKQVVDYSRVDAGLENPWMDRLNYVRDRMMSGPTQTIEPKSLIDLIGAHTSSFNPKSAQNGMKFRMENAARAKARDNKKNGIPVSRTLKRQESGKVPFPIQGGQE